MHSASRRVPPSDQTEPPDVVVAGWAVVRLRSLSWDRREPWAMRSVSAGDPDVPRSVTLSFASRSRSSTNEAPLVAVRMLTTASLDRASLDSGSAPAAPSAACRYVEPSRRKLVRDETRRFGQQTLDDAAGATAPLRSEDAFVGRYPNQSGRVRECVGVSDRRAQDPALRLPASPTLLKSSSTCPCGRREAD
jgi:hypothetical protein